MPQNEYLCSPTDHNIQGMYFSNDNEPTERKGSVFVEYTRKSQEGIYDMAGGGTFSDFESTVSVCNPGDAQKTRVKRKTRRITLGLVAFALLFGLILFGVYHAITDKQKGM